MICPLTPVVFSVFFSFTVFSAFFFYICPLSCPRSTHQSNPLLAIHLSLGTPLFHFSPCVVFSPIPGSPLPPPTHFGFLFEVRFCLLLEQSHSVFSCPVFSTNYLLQTAPPIVAGVVVFFLSPGLFLFISYLPICMWVLGVFIPLVFFFS